MIAANELRICNIIQDICGNFIEVESIDFRENGINLSESCIPLYYSSDIYGVPLTEEILFKCGFCIEVYGSKFILNGISLIRIDNGKMDLRIPQIYFDIDGRYMRSISFIHQLHNLYFELTGKELEVKL